MEEATETYNSKIQAMWDEYNNLFEQAEKVALVSSFFLFIIFHHYRLHSAAALISILSVLFC